MFMFVPKISEIKIILHSVEEDETIEKMMIAMTKVLGADKPTEITNLANKLINVPYPILIQLCKKYPEIEIFFHTNIEFNMLMKDKLASAGHVSSDIYSMDGLERYSVFNLYIAASYMSDYINTSNSQILRDQALDQACTLGLNNALTVQCERLANLVRNAKLYDDQQKYLSELLAATSRLSNLYWATGYLQSGCFLHSLSCFFNLASKDKENSQGSALLEQAVKNFLVASFLAPITYSERIFNLITQGKGVTEIIGDDIKFNHIDEIPAICRQWIGKDNFIIIEEQAKQEMQEKCNGDISHLAELLNNLDGNSVIFQSIEFALIDTGWEKLKLFFQAHKAQQFNAATRHFIICFLLFHGHSDYEPLYLPRLLQLLKNNGFNISSYEEGCQQCISWIGQEAYKYEYMQATKNVYDLLVNIPLSILIVATDQKKPSELISDARLFKQHHESKAIPVVCAPIKPVNIQKYH